MAIYGKETTDEVLAAAALTTNKTNELYAHANQTINILQRRAAKMKTIVDEGGGNATVVAELGADAAEMQAFYTALKDLVETYSSISVPTF